MSVASKKVDYIDCLDAFGKATAEALAFTIAPWADANYVGAPGIAKDRHADLKDTLRAFYANHVKPKFVGTAGEGGEGHPLEQELGRVYGSLMLNLEALCASWRVLYYERSAPKLHINFHDKAKEATDTAMHQVTLHTQMAADIAAQLLRQESELRMRTQIFASLVLGYIQGHGLTYPQVGVRSPTAIRASKQSHNRAALEAEYIDYPDKKTCYAPIGIFFRDGPGFQFGNGRKLLLQFVEEAFGKWTYLEDDNSTLRFDRPFSVELSRLT